MRSPVSIAARRGAVAPGARLVRGDRRERAAFERTLQAERFDAVIDMLCFTRADALSSLRGCVASFHSGLFGV
jgi:hypothetical protein